LGAEEWRASDSRRVSTRSKLCVCVFVCERERKKERVCGLLQILGGYLHVVSCVYVFVCVCA